MALIDLTDFICYYRGDNLFLLLASIVIVHRSSRTCLFGQ